MWQPCIIYIYIYAHVYVCVLFAVVKNDNQTAFQRQPRANIKLLQGGRVCNRA